MAERPSTFRGEPLMSAQMRSSSGSDSGTSLGRPRGEALQSLDALTRSALPSMLLMLLMRAGERDGTEPLGRAVGCLGALQGHLARRDADPATDAPLAPETRRLGRDAIGALFSAVTTLRERTD